MRISLAFASGILAAYYGAANYWVVIVSLGLSLGAYLLIIIFLSRPAFYQWSPGLGLLGLGCIFLLGCWSLFTYQERYTWDSLTHQLQDTEAYLATAIEDAQEKESSHRVTVVISQARMQGKWQRSQGRVRLYIASPTFAEIKYGDVLLVLGQPQAIAAPINPHAFDHRAWLRQDGICYQHFIHKSSTKKLYNAPPNYLRALVLQMRRYCSRILAQSISKKREQAVILALVLGTKDELDLATKVAYASAGTMHVLAVSGLHVGVLYGLLRALLGGPGNALRTNWWRTILLLAGLWIYACITGLAPSVLRATLMFSLVVVARLLGRASNIYNTLAGSAFMLLLGNPYWIFSVGFQLSYLAILGIVYLQPKIYRWIELKNVLLRQLWRLTAVSLAVQLATAPISLYYFHQFPTYFIVANWVVVPATFLMLSLGLAVLLTSFWPDLSTPLAWLLAQLTWLVNQFVEQVSSLPLSALEDIYLDIPTLLLWYGLLVTLLTFLQRKRILYLVIATGAALSLCVRTTQAFLQHQKQQGVIFYNIHGYQAVNFIRGPTSTLCTDERLLAHEKQYTYHIKPSQLAMGIRHSHRYSFQEAVSSPDFPLQVWAGCSIGVWGQKKFIFIDGPPVHGPWLTQKMYVDFLVIEANALTSLEPLLSKFEIGVLIIGASNKKQLALRLSVEADQLNLPCHSLHQQGAFQAYW
ncbi:MAG: ComEC/Rec2 family competence protein [Bacteroidota bacterium]